MSAIPVVDVIVDPYSPTSEAYRRLHVAILTAPPVTWVRRGYGSQDDLFEMPSLRPPQELLVGASAPGGTAQAPGGPGVNPVAGRMNLPVPVGSGTLARPQRARFSILVTAPSDEPTRSLVVVNLAAVFAEAGDRVLVATTGGMRTNIDGNGKMPRPGTGPTPELTASELVANARPSQIPGVSSLALGQLFPNPSKLALNAPGLVEAARDVVDVVLFEAPLLSTQDGTALLPAADLVVVVCEAWHTTVSNGQQTQRLLAQHRPPVLGLVMTNMRADHPSLERGALRPGVRPFAGEGGRGRKDSWPQLGGSSSPSSCCSAGVGPNGHARRRPDRATSPCVRRCWRPAAGAVPNRPGATPASSPSRGPGPGGNGCREVMGTPWLVRVAGTVR